MDAVVQKETEIETEIETASWQMDIKEFDANGCLINGD